MGRHSSDSVSSMCFVCDLCTLVLWQYGFSFVDEIRLVDTIRNIPPSEFTAEELSRNVHLDDEIYRFDPNIVCERVPSTIPQLYPDLVQCHTTSTPFIVPPIPGDGRYRWVGFCVSFTITATIPTNFVCLRSALCKGLAMPAPSFPHLGALKVSMSLSPVGVNVFGTESRKSSLVVTIHPSKSTMTGMEAAQRLLGKTVVVKWPFLRQAKVVAISNQDVRYET